MPVGTDDGQYFTDEREYQADQTQPKRVNLTLPDNSDKPSPDIDDRRDESWLTKTQDYLRTNLSPDKWEYIKNNFSLTGGDLSYNSWLTQKNTIAQPPVPESQMGDDLGYSSIPSTMPVESLPKPADALKSSGGTQTPGNSGKVEPEVYYQGPYGSITSDDVDKTIPIALAFSGGGLSFKGVKAATFDRAALNTAQEMEASGAHPDDIWDKTGTFRGADNRWRQEIPDYKSSLKYENLEGNPLGKVAVPNPTSFSSNLKSILTGKPIPASTTLSDILDHPELYKAYPEIANWKVAPLSKELADQGIRGMASDKALYVIPESPETFRSILLHEAQHYIQDKEGFARGSSVAEHIDPTYDAAKKLYETELSKGTSPNEPKMVKAKQILDDEADRAFKAYERVVGEVEARNVQKRMNWNRALKIPPTRSEDTPRFVQTIQR